MPSLRLHAIEGTIIRFFASSHRLDQLSPRTLVLTSLFLLGIILQLATGAMMQHRGPGWTTTSVVEHYRGRSIDTASLTPEQLQAALAGDPTVAELPAKTFDGLLDVAHMHLAFMPILVFVVAHLFSMAPWGKSRWAGVLCYATFAAAFADIAAPFLIRYVDAGFASLKIASFVMLEAGMLIMIAATLAPGVLALRQRPPPA